MGQKVFVERRAAQEHVAHSCPIRNVPRRQISIERRAASEHEFHIDGIRDLPVGQVNVRQIKWFSGYIIGLSVKQV